MIAVRRVSVSSLLRDRVVVRRAVVGMTFSLVAIAMLANTVFRPTNSVMTRVPDARVNVAGDSVAQAFATAYLLVDDGDGSRDRALAAFGTNQAWDVTASTTAPARRVVATQITGVTVRADNHDRIVTIQATLSTGTVTYLAVRTRSRDGVTSIVGAPAVVGGPPRGEPVDERETDGDAVEPAVQSVVARALRHLLAGRGADLAPDLAPGASVSLPAAPLVLEDVVSVQWEAIPTPAGGSAMARVTARDPDGVELTLDYELDLVKTDQGRWQLAVVHLPTGSQS